MTCNSITYSSFHSVTHPIRGCMYILVLTYE